MNLPLHFSILAKNDIAGISDYTERQWGRAQARIYVRELIDGIETLSSHPQIGSPVTQVRPGYRKLNIASHSVYYQVQEDKVEIVRILHQRMDVVSQF